MTTFNGLSFAALQRADALHQPGELHGREGGRRGWRSRDGAGCARDLGRGWKISPSKVGI